MFWALQGVFQALFETVHCQRENKYFFEQNFYLLQLAKILRSQLKLGTWYNLYHHKKFAWIINALMFTSLPLA